MIIHSENYNKYGLYCAAFCLSVFLFLDSGSFFVPGACAILLALCSVGLLFVKGDYRYYCRIASRVILSAVAGIFVAMSARAVYYVPAEKFIHEYGGAQCELLVEIEEIASRGDNYANYNAVILSADGKAINQKFGVNPKIRISAFGDDFLKVGEIVSFSAVPSVPEQVTAGGFEERRYLESQCIFVTCTAESAFLPVAQRKMNAVESIRSKMSEGISKYIGKYTQGYEAAVSKCMLLGDKSEIDSYLKDIFRASGVSHVLSVSGLHLSILFYTVMYIFGLRRNRKRRRFPAAELVSCTVAILYMIISGFTPSIMRAGFMLIISSAFEAYKYYVQKLSKPESIMRSQRFGHFDSLTSLLGAAAVICVVSPYSLYDIGMQMSFLSTLGIVLSMSVYSKYKVRINPFFIRPVITSLVITLSAVSFTFPVCVYNFGALSSMSALSNLLITPIITPLLALLLFLALLSLLPAAVPVVFICSLLGKISAFLASICIRIAEINSSFAFSNLDAADNFTVNMLFSALVITAVVFAIFRHRRTSVIACGSVIVLFLACTSVYFTNTAISYGKPTLSIGTLSQLPYACARVADTRVIFDSGEGLASRHFMSEVLGNDLYKTDNIYTVSICEDTDLESVYYNVTVFNENNGINTLLLPSLKACDRAGFDREAYMYFVRKLQERNYDICFYSEEIALGNTVIKCKHDKSYTSFEFSDYAVIFADEYSTELAASFAKGKDYCVFFCKRVSSADEGNYNSHAQLYVTSPVHKEIDGANRIIPQKVTLLE